MINYEDNMTKKVNEHSSYAHRKEMSNVEKFKGLENRASNSLGYVSN